jgi:hypothetical protein
MRLPSTTSKLIALQEATNVELKMRLEEIFKRYRSVAFAGRNDNLFTEHWTPEVAASGYDFEGFELKNSDIVLRGVEYACGFIYAFVLPSLWPLSTMRQRLNPTSNARSRKSKRT